MSEKRFTHFVGEQRHPNRPHRVCVWPFNAATPYERLTRDEADAILKRYNTIDRQNGWTYTVVDENGFTPRLHDDGL